MEDKMEFDKKYDEMNYGEKAKAIYKVIKEKVMPMLAFDGGTVEVIDMKENDLGEMQVYIRYGGACSACSSAGGATLFAIEESIRKELDTNKVKVIQV